ncbi:MAG TPA: class I SAM-dependent methyltransferase [Gemmatimonadaceae bacterium]|nr:class I SAM-dependent methyltransferase [Gemmatimonadaceae bacterium]
MYDCIATLAPRRDVVWDCGTGNGQAAADLARYFGRVIATDASAEQIANAVPAQGVEYRVAPASSSGLPAASVHAVTVAQALHWFAEESFFAEARRVTVPGGIIAAWCYGQCHAGADVEGILRELEDGTLGGYWRPERRYVDELYRSIPFPFPEVPAPTFELRVRWNLRQLIEYLNTWSAVVAYRRKHGTDPVVPVQQRLADTWGDPRDVRDVTWPLGLRLGRVG